MPHRCSSCCAMKEASDFSKTQLSKLNARRCKQCIAAAAVATPPHLPATAGGQPTEPTVSHTTSSATRRRAGRTQPTHQPASTQGGLVRVRDVEQHYGHLCEIPLQAYIDAGVASSWSDFVSEDDIEQASNAWDARSICHEIDTQWGDMPQGGAYKDSNYYWGPGEYDFI